MIVVKFCDYYGFLKYLDRFANAIVRPTFFHPVTGKAFLANLGSVYAGSAMLVDKYDRNEISRVNLILSVIFAGFLPRIRILFTYSLPIVVSLLTLPVALFYSAFFLLVAVIRLLLSIVLARMILSHEIQDMYPPVFSASENIDSFPQIDKPSIYETAAKSVISACRLVFRIVIHIILITSLFNYLQYKEIFNYIPLYLSWFNLPDNCSPAFYAYIAHAYSGMGIVGQYLANGTISSVTGMKLLLFCMMTTRPIVALKEAPSYYFGVYGIKNGSIIVMFDIIVFTVLGLAAFIIL